MKTLKKLEVKKVLKTRWIKGGEEQHSDDEEMKQAKDRRVTFKLL